MLTLDNRLIPERLRNIPDPPKILYNRGEDINGLLDKPVVAVVGSRKVDSYGIHATRLLSGGLAEKGIVIASGLALGVDAIAHQACLDSGGQTIAVLACGIDDIYPRTNANLAKKVEQNGAIISEHGGNYNPFPHDFLIRNRLVSGLADAVIITQAAARSGSLNTARHALEQGKFVMAVPGPITNPLCEGPNNLLKMGATPVTSVDDVLNILGIDTRLESTRNYQLLAESADELAIIKLLEQGISDADQLAGELSISAQKLNIHLTMLEIRGIIAPLGANNWTLK